MSKQKQVLTLEDALADVEARFLYNLPDEELRRSDRLFFQIEQAHWFYEDFMADKHANLPHFKLKAFAEKIFTHCSLFSNMQDQCASLFHDFSAYRSKIPVFGCVMLNPEMTKAVLVKSYYGKCWGFPKGKVNQNESPLLCAAREVHEETGYNPLDHCKEENVIAYHEENKLIKLFIAIDVPENTVFNTMTRKEISKVEFHPLSDLPEGCYGVHQFLPSLHRWIRIEKERKAKELKEARKRAKEKGRGGAGARVVADCEDVKEEKFPKGRTRKAGMDEDDERDDTDLLLSSAFDERNQATFADEPGSTGWKVDDMFAAVTKLTGRKYDYDGNPHNFGASHPRYKNFNDTQDATSSGGAQCSDNIHPAMLQSQRKTIACNRLTSKFVFEKASIMKAVDDALKEL